MLMNENRIDLNCPYPQTYCAILTHKPENLDFAKKHFGDRDNRLYLSDTNVEGTLNIYQEGYDSRVFGELPRMDVDCGTYKRTGLVFTKCLSQKVEVGNWYIGCSATSMGMLCVRPVS